MPANRIVQIKTVQGGNAPVPTFAILTNVDVKDATTAEHFLREVAEVFLCHRMCSPPETDAMLLTIIGDLSAAQCAKLWRKIMAEDTALTFFMSQMRVADVIRGTASGQELEKVSIIDGLVFPETLREMRHADSVARAPRKTQKSELNAWFRKLFCG